MFGGCSSWPGPVAMEETPSKTSKEVGRSRHSSNHRRMPVVPIAHTFVNNILDGYLLTFFRRLRGREGCQSARGVIVMVKDERQPRRHR